MERKQRAIRMLAEHFYKCVADLDYKKQYQDKILKVCNGIAEKFVALVSGYALQLPVSEYEFFKCEDEYDQIVLKVLAAISRDCQYVPNKKSVSEEVFSLICKSQPFWDKIISLYLMAEFAINEFVWQISEIKKE